MANCSECYTKGIPGATRVYQKPIWSGVAGGMDHSVKCFSQGLTTEWRFAGTGRWEERREKSPGQRKHTQGYFEDLMTSPIWKTLYKWIVGTDLRYYYHYSASHFTFYNLSFLHLSNENTCSAYFRQPSYALSEVINEKALEHHWNINPGSSPPFVLFVPNESLKSRKLTWSTCVSLSPQIR